MPTLVFVSSLYPYLSHSVQQLENGGGGIKDSNWENGTTIFFYLFYMYYRSTVLNEALPKARSMLETSIWGYIIIHSIDVYSGCEQGFVIAWTIILCFLG